MSIAQMAMFCAKRISAQEGFDQKNIKAFMAFVRNRLIDEQKRDIAKGILLKNTVILCLGSTFCTL
jgi:hypothetical protein